MKNCSRKEQLGMNKTQRDFSPVAEINEEKEEEKQGTGRLNKFAIKNPPKRLLNLPFGLFKRKASSKPPDTGEQSNKAPARQLIHIHLSPASRPKQNLGNVSQYINGSNGSPHTAAFKSPRGNIHKLKIATKDIQELGNALKHPEIKISPKNINNQQKLNGALWDSASKGDLIQITHLLDPYRSLFNHNLAFQKQTV